jgi:hypothetical protein
VSWRDAMAASSLCFGIAPPSADFMEGDDDDDEDEDDDDEVDDDGERTRQFGIKQFFSLINSRGLLVCLLACLLACWNGACVVDNFDLAPVLMFEGESEDEELATRAYLMDSESDAEAADIQSDGGFTFPARKRPLDYASRANASSIKRPHF